MRTVCKRCKTIWTRFRVSPWRINQTNFLSRVVIFLQNFPTLWPSFSFNVCFLVRTRRQMYTDAHHITRTEWDLLGWTRLACPWFTLHLNVCQCVNVCACVCVLACPWFTLHLNVSSLLHAHILTHRHTTHTQRYAPLVLSSVSPPPSFFLSLSFALFLSLSLSH